MPSPVKLEDLATDLPVSASSKAKAKQAVQSRANFQSPVSPAASCLCCFLIREFSDYFDIFSCMICPLSCSCPCVQTPALFRPQVTQSLADVFNEFDFLGVRQ
jgi:hypothetical protein